MTSELSILGIPPKFGTRCVTFTCDEGYLFPTLMAAKMARANTADNTDIVVFVESSGLTPERVKIMEAASGAMVRGIPQSVVDLLDARVSPSIFVRTKASRAALYRLFIAELLDNSYERILYLDGDIQIVRSLIPLIETTLPEGYVAAAPDWAAIHIRSGIGLPESEKPFFEGLFTDIQMPEDTWGSYFNSGMMLASPQTWAKIGPEALEFLVSNPDACKFVDQCAINYACRGKVKLVSIRYNYLREFMKSASYRDIDPAMIHYTGKPKPWDGAFWPWGPAEFKVYGAMAAALEGSGVNWRRMPMKRRVAYTVKPLLRKHDYNTPPYRAKLREALLFCAKEPAS